MYLIFGNTETSLEVARKLDNYLLIVHDPVSFSKLEKEGYKVKLIPLDEIHTLPNLSTLPLKNSTVILASDVETNLKVAEKVKGIAKDVIAVGENPEVCNLYSETGISKVCENSIAVAVLSEVSELERRYVEVRVDSEEDRSLKDVDLGDFCTVLSVIRDGKLLKPFPDLKLKRGDILGVLCGREVKYTKNPFEEVLVILTNEVSREKLLREAELFEARFKSQILFMHKIGDAFACSIGASKPSVVQLSDAIDVLKEFKVKPDLIISDFGKKDESILKELVSISPVLISKGKGFYERVLAIVNSSSPVNLLKAAISFGGSCKCKILFLDPSQLSIVSELTETPGVEIEVSKGNPVIDAVREAKADYDLILLSYANDFGNIDRGILRKIIFDTEASALVM